MCVHLVQRLAVCALGVAAFAGSAGADVAVFRNGAATPIVGGTYAGTEDNTLVNNAGGETNHNFGGSSSVFQIGQFGGLVRRGLFRFDVTPLTGQAQTIDSVTLRLHVEGVEAAPGTLNLFRIADANANWVEGTATSGVQGGSSSWAFRQTASLSWAGSEGLGTAGVDYVATPLASAGYTSAMTAGTALDFTFADVSFIDDWIAGNNAGLLLRATSESTANRLHFFASESTELAMRPELIVMYSVPEPSLALGGAVAVLLLAGRTRRGGRTQRA